QRGRRGISSTQEEEIAAFVYYNLLGGVARRQHIKHTESHLWSNEVALTAALVKVIALADHEEGRTDEPTMRWKEHPLGGNARGSNHFQTFLHTQNEVVILAEAGTCGASNNSEKETRKESISKLGAEKKRKKSIEGEALSQAQEKQQKDFQASRKFRANLLLLHGLASPRLRNRHRTVTKPSNDGAGNLGENYSSFDLRVTIESFLQQVIPSARKMTTSKSAPAELSNPGKSKPTMHEDMFVIALVAKEVAESAESVWGEKEPTRNQKLAIAELTIQEFVTNLSGKPLISTEASRVWDQPQLMQACVVAAAKSADPAAYCPPLRRINKINESPGDSYRALLEYSEKHCYLEEIQSDDEDFFFQSLSPPRGLVRSRQSEARSSREPTMHRTNKLGEGQSTDGCDPREPLLLPKNSITSRTRGVNTEKALKFRRVEDQGAIKAQGIMIQGSTNTASASSSVASTPASKPTSQPFTRITPNLNASRFFEGVHTMEEEQHSSEEHKHRHDNARKEKKQRDKETHELFFTREETSNNSVMAKANGNQSGDMDKPRTTIVKGKVYESDSDTSSMEDLLMQAVNESGAYGKRSNSTHLIDFPKKSKKKGDNSKEVMMPREGR
ncbi:unnamed protein product, partial [Amoebophrya sp. A25]